MDYTVRSGKALYVGISSYPPEQTREAARILREMGTPCLIHQPSYSMFNRWIEDSLLDTLEDEGIGCIAFSPLAQGLLTNKYLNGVPENSRAVNAGSFMDKFLNEISLGHVNALNDMAEKRGQSLAQMAIAWVLRDSRVTSALIGASSIKQLEDSLAATNKLDFSKQELSAIDEHAKDMDINIWANRT